MAERHHEIDPVSGVPLSDHEWDGIRELETRPPRWWVLVYMACCVFAIGYWLVYPAWPTLSGFTQGWFAWSSRGAANTQLQAAEAAQAALNDKLRASPFDAIAKDPELLRFALAGGRAAFVNNCAQCHGAGAQGQGGYPNLLDDDWLWGGKAADIERTILVGINSTHADTRLTQMPAFGTAGILNRQQIDDAAEHVLSLSRRQTDAIAAGRGRTLYLEQCASCHGTKGEGNREVGGPRLNDAIWLYGGDKATIVQTIAQTRRGVMPAWEGRLSELTIKKLTLYVHSLGGGE
ncbi:MAG: cytochrome-c oxidase, cbb3-type subunit III [Proteobacteria bacterium]|nr:cytochrome-c oxidase, cbb3-type subunit III [Pseudomonadota bacterium]